MNWQSQDTKPSFQVLRNTQDAGGRGKEMMSRFSSLLICSFSLFDETNTFVF